MNRQKALMLIVVLVTQFWLTPDILSSQNKEEKVDKTRPFNELIKDLRSEDKLLRSRAAEELGDRKNKEAVPYLIEGLKDAELTVKDTSCAALGKIKDERALPALIQKVQDANENWAVKKTAAESLIAIDTIGKPETFHALINVLKYECETDRTIVYPPSRSGSISVDEKTERAFAEKLQQFVATAKERDAYISSLVGYINNKKLPKLFRYRLAVILGQLQVKTTVPVLIDCLNDCKRGELRTLAAGLLGKLGDKSAIPHLKRALQDDFLNLGYAGTIELGEGMIQTDRIIEGKSIFSAEEITRERNGYRIRDYTVRNAAAASLRDLGLTIVKQGKGYKIIE